MDWKAHIAEDLGALLLDGRRVTIWRRLGDGTEIITGFTEHGSPVVESLPANAQTDFRGFTIPVAALEAIAEAIKPGPSQGETRRLEEALATERRRVDDILAQALR